MSRFSVKCIIVWSVCAGWCASGMAFAAHPAFFVPGFVLNAGFIVYVMTRPAAVTA